MMNVGTQMRNIRDALNTVNEFSFNKKYTIGDW